METELLIIEEGHIHVFTDEIEHALSDGYTVAASNSFWDFGRNCIRYYALLTRPAGYHDIPLTITTDRPLPIQFD